MIKFLKKNQYFLIENEKVFLESKINYLIHIKKNKKKILFIRKEKKNIFINKNSICFFFFHNKYNFLLFFNLILNNILKKETIFFLKNKIISIKYEKNSIIIYCYKKNFYVKYFVKVFFINELNINIKKFFLINNNFFFFEKKNLIFNLNIFNNIYKNIKKINFKFLLINLKKKKKIYLFLKKNLKNVIYTFNNILFIKKTKNNIFLKIKIFLKIGKNFLTYIDYNYLKKYFLQNKKIILNYCNKSKLIIIKKYNFLSNEENYLKNLNFY